MDASVEGLAGEGNTRSEERKMQYGDSGQKRSLSCQLRMVMRKKISRTQGTRQRGADTGRKEISEK